MAGWIFLDCNADALFDSSKLPITGRYLQRATVKVRSLCVQHTMVACLVILPTEGAGCAMCYWIHYAYGAVYKLCSKAVIAASTDSKMMLQPHDLIIVTTFQVRWRCFFNHRTFLRRCRYHHLLRLRTPPNRTVGLRKIHQMILARAKFSSSSTQFRRCWL